MKEQQKLNINIPEDLVSGKYTNLAVITHSSIEFILDFVAMMPGSDKANVISRVVMTPQNAKRLLTALNENIKKFESTNGTIKEANIEIPFIGNGGALA